MKYSVFSIQYSVFIVLALLFAGCEKNGMTGGDPDYWTTSRGQFTVKVPQGDHTVTMFFLDNGDGTATVTFDGSNPLHWASSSSTSVSVRTYADTIEVPASVSYNGQTFRVVAIGNEAFMGCDSLKQVILPESVKSIGEGAFTLCKKLKSFNIPSGVTVLPLCAFSQCSSLDSIDLPANIKTIGKMAFYGCTHIQKVTLHNGLTSIGEMAFYDCSSTKLQDITLPASVQTIGKDVFGGYSAEHSSHILGYYILSTTPPTLEGELYNKSFASTDVTVYVPASAVGAYLAATNWNTLTIKADE